MGTPDGRWTLVSTSLTTGIALTVTLLASVAMPASTAKTYEPQRQSTALPYDLLRRLAGIPSQSSDTSGRYRSASLIVAPDFLGPLDRVLAAEHATPVPSVETRTLKVDNGETIMGMLQDAGVSNQDAAKIVDAMKPIYNPRNIRSGQAFKATFGAAKDAPPAVPGAIPEEAQDNADEDDSLSRRLLSLTFSPSVEREVTVRMTAPDNYLGLDVHRRLESRYERTTATIDSSLYLAAVQAGIPTNMVVELIRLFSYDVDFQRDVHEGDSFEVVFNRFYTPDGQPAKTGDILEASMTLGGKTQTVYRFDTADGAEYFDDKGRSAKSMLMKTPVDGARISSRFGSRRHPILGYTRMHKGMDFAVPTGTPVMAAGNGTVVFAGRANGYGNFVVINHANGYATAYGHLSRYGSGIRAGARVRQGQIVAFSGMTGLATGPHLHYEIRMHDRQVNPASLRMASGRALEGAELAKFQDEKQRIDTMVAALPVQKKLADASASQPSSSR